MKCYVHDKAKLMADKKVARLIYHGAGNHILIPTGQQVRETPKDRTVSGKSARRQRIAAKRARRAEGGAA